MQKKLVALLLCAGILICGGAGALAEHLSILLIGQDDAASYAAPGQSASFGRADAMLIATLDLQTGDTRLLSVDRDYQITLDGHGETKLSIANYFGGPEAQLRAVNDLLGLSVPLYAMVGKSQMGEIVDAMGGVTVDVTADELSGSSLTQTGPQRLTGAQAVAYMGERTMDGSGDAGRNERQRKVLSAILEEAFSGGAQSTLSFVQSVLPMMESNITLQDAMRVLSALMLTDVSLPRQDRTPRMSDRMWRVTNGHEVAYVQDMDAERARVYAFLYE